MAKWLLQHLKGKTEVLPDGSKVVDGIVETNDNNEPKVSKIIREYYGAVKFEETAPAASASAAPVTMTAGAAPAPGANSPAPGAADQVKAGK